MDRAPRYLLWEALVAPAGNMALGDTQMAVRGMGRSSIKDVPEEGVLVPSGLYAKSKDSHTPGSSKIPGWNSTYSSCFIVHLPVCPPFGPDPDPWPSIPLSFKRCLAFLSSSYLC